VKSIELIHEKAEVSLRKLNTRLAIWFELSNDKAKFDVSKLTFGNMDWIRTVL
jgi:hypothetical protein